MKIDLAVSFYSKFLACHKINIFIFGCQTKIQTQLKNIEESKEKKQLILQKVDK